MRLLWHNMNTHTSGVVVNILDDITHTGRKAYSLRQLYSTATNAVKVREDGGDTLADIGFDGNGDLDVSALTTHLGANNGFVHTWYDQSAAGENAVQTTNGLQPKITVNASNSKYGVEFVRASSTRLATSGGADVAQPFDVYMVAEEVSGPAAVAAISDGESVTNRWRFWRALATANGNLYLQIASAFSSPDGEKDFPLAEIAGIYDGASSSIRKNGSSIQSGDVGAGSARGATIGTTNAGGSGFNGYIHEYIQVDQLASGDRDTLEANQQAYWGV
jgi:hypothetical protein